MNTPIAPQHTINTIISFWNLLAAWELRVIMLQYNNMKAKKNVAMLFSIPNKSATSPLQKTA